MDGTGSPWVHLSAGTLCGRRAGRKASFSLSLTFHILSSFNHCGFCALPSRSWAFSWGPEKPWGGRGSDIYLNDHTVIEQDIRVPPWASSPWSACNPSLPWLLLPSSSSLSSLFLFSFFFFFFFWGGGLPGIRSESQPMQRQQSGILNPLGWAGDRTCVTDPTAPQWELHP